MIKVVYKSRKNNKKIAKAIAEELKINAESIDTVRNVQADLLFLGCAIRGGNVAPEVDEFIEHLDSSQVKRVALFSSNGLGSDQFAPLKEKLAGKGIDVETDVFSCKGNAFIFMNMGKPGTEDLDAARDFARRVTGRGSI